MFLAKIILLFFIFKIDRLGAIRTASLMIGNNAEVNMENFLIEFMNDVKIFGFDKLHPTRLIVLGKKENLLQTTKILLESGRTPYFISSEAGAIALPLYFGTDSVVLFFVDGFSDSEMNSTFAKLPSDYKCRALLISMEDDKPDQSMNALISAAANMNLKNVLVTRTDGHAIEIYGHRVDASCDRKLKLVNTWIPKKGFSENENVVEHRLPINNSHGCPKFVSTFDLSPTMRLHKRENNTWHITGGLEGNLVETIAKYLNMKLLVTVPSVVDKLWVNPDGTVTGIIGDVAREVATFGIGQIRPTRERARIVDLTAPYNHECMVWTVPLSTRYKHNVVFSEFSCFTWIMVILSVCLSCGLVYAIPRLQMGYSSSFTILDVIAMTLNYGIPRTPSGVLYKLFFLVYLNYSRIISTAYSTSLSSILTATTPAPVIVDEAGILAAGLRTAGTQSSRDMLARQISANSTRSGLIKRYEVITSAEVALARIADRQDIAYLRHRSTIIHIANNLAMAGKPVKFHHLPGCVISYNSVMATPKGSHLTRQVNDIIMRLREAGIYNHWLNINRAFKSEIKNIESINDSLSRLESIFFLYLCCLVPAFLAFAAELIAFKLKLNSFTP